MSEATFSIGEVADMLGLSAHTIRAWERRHLLASPKRTAAGQRRYTLEDVELLRQIKHGRHALGFSIRVATMAAQGSLVPESAELDAERIGPAVDAEGAVDPVRRLVDLVPDVVVVVDTEGRIRHANTAFVRFCETVSSELQGLHFADIVDPFDRAKAVQVYRPPLHPRRGWEFGLRTRRRRALFAFDCWPLPSAEGPVLALIGRQVDITPPAIETFAAGAGGDGAVETGLRAPPHPVRALLHGVANPVRTLELLRPWLDTTPFGVVLAETDPDLTVLVANDAFRQLLPPGWEPIEGRPWRELAPAADARRLTVAVREVSVSAQRRTVSGHRPSRDDPGPSPAPVWDVDLWPVIEVGGAVTHVLLTVRDATGEAAAAQRLEALVNCAPELRQAPDARHVLATAARHSQTLFSDADALVVATRGGEALGMNVVAAEGVWSRSERDTERDLRMALVRDVVKHGTSIEIERLGPEEAPERVMAVPLLAREPRRVLGALAFCRHDGSPFSTEDRLLVEEFAGRVGLALAQADLLTDPGTR